MQHCLRPAACIKLVHHKPASFKLHMGADEDLVARFWHGYRNSADGREAIALHPHLKHFTDEDFKYTVPCVLHEDAGPYSKNRSCDIVSWSSLTGRGSDLLTKYVHHTELKHSGLDRTSAQASWDAFFRTSTPSHTALIQKLANMSCVPPTVCLGDLC